MKVINEEIKNETYEKLIDYAYKKCDVVMFAAYNYRDYYAEEVKKLNNYIKKFDIYILDIKESNNWGRIYEDGMKLIFYKFEQPLKDYLNENKSLYRWDYPEYLTDINFFINGRCWLTSITHEEMCDIFVESKEEYEYLKSIGIEFLEEGYREIKDDEVFIEKFEN